MHSLIHFSFTPGGRLTQKVESHARKWKFGKTHIVWTFITDLPLPPPIPHTSGRLHTVSLWMGLLIKPPFHTFPVLLENIVTEHGLFVLENPPFHTHFVSFWFLPPYHTQSYKFYPHFVSTQFHTIFQISTPHSTPNSVRACYSTFWASRPPPGVLPILCISVDQKLPTR